MAFIAPAAQVASIVWSKRALATADNPGPVRAREWRDFGPEKWLAGGAGPPGRRSRFVSVVRAGDQRVNRKAGGTLR